MVQIFWEVERAKYLILFGGRTRTRTLDPLIKSQLLYQLSYAPGARIEASRAGVL